MQVVYAVIDDIYEFTVGAVFRYVQSSEYRDAPHTLPLLSPDSTSPSQHEDFTQENETEEVQTFRTLSTLIDERVHTDTLTHTIAYVSSARAPLFATPAKDFDTVITTLPYGAMAMVLEEKGRFIRVAQDGITGWVLKEDLADRAAYVYPEFVGGEKNDADDPNTLRLRACIKDEFFGGESESPLQAGEYVLYKLIRKGQSINWSPTRPRKPGEWHTILRGAPGIYIGIVPKSQSVMEYSLQNGVGQLAYVEAVFPDERITFTEVNNPDHGIYNERTLTKEEWQTLNPVFIQVS